MIIVLFFVPASPQEVIVPHFMPTRLIVVLFFLKHGIFDALNPFHSTRSSSALVEIRCTHLESGADGGYYLFADCFSLMKRHGSGWWHPRRVEPKIGHTVAMQWLWMPSPWSSIVAYALTMGLMPLACYDEDACASILWGAEVDYDGCRCNVSVGMSPLNRCRLLRPALAVDAKPIAVDVSGTAIALYSWSIDRVMEEQQLFEWIEWRMKWMMTPS